MTANQAGDATPRRRALDVVVVTDLRFSGGTSSSLADELVAAADGGYEVGVLHLANPRLGRTAAVHPTLRRLLDGGTAHLLLPGEPVQARLAIVKHPMVFASSLGGPLPIDVENVLVTVGQVPADRHDRYYDPKAVDDHIAEAFARRAIWAPVSPTVRAALHDVTLTEHDWVEVIDPEAWHRTTSIPAGDESAASRAGRADDRLVIGRHSRPDALKWPDEADAIRAAYPTDASVRVRILGGADAAIAVLGETPSNWEVLAFGAVDPAEFLAGLDGFVYFHHPDLTEAFGRTILEALAARVPAVVPAHFEPLFGDACLYATPDTAIETVQALLADDDARLRHTERASQMVEERFSHDAHRARLAALIGAPAAPATRAMAPRGVLRRRRGERTTPRAAGAAAPVAPQLDLVPPRLRSSTTTTLIACLGARRTEVEALLRALDEHRRHAPGFIPLVVITITRPDLAVELGIETHVITGRAKWADPGEAWPDYAQRRLRQLAAHFAVDNITAADPTHPDAWIALQMRRSADR
jgi:hypothetical protein